MVYCAAFGCSNRLKKGSGISFFKFPKDVSRRKTWEHFCRRADFTATNHHTLCSEHFSMNMFLYHPDKIADLGMQSPMKTLLKDTAVPDIRLHLGSEAEAFSPKVRGAFAKRQRAEVLNGALGDFTRELLDKENIGTDSTSIDHDAYDDQEEFVDLPPINHHQRQDCVFSGPNTEKPTLITKSVQVDSKPSQRTRRIQVRPRLTNEQVSVGIQCCLIEAPPLRKEALDSDVESESECDMDWDDHSDQQTFMDDSDEYNPDLESDCDDDIDDVDDDIQNYILASDVDIGSEKQFLVSESALNKILSVCRTCGRHCQSVIKFVKGTMICVASVCDEGHVFEWKSQTCQNSMPWSNLLVSAAVFFSGASFSKTLQLFNHMNLQMFSRRTFMNIQSGYLVPATLKVWETTQAEMLETRQGQSLTLGGDCRCDSPGYSAKYGSYSLMDLQTNEVLDVQLVQSNEVKGSTHMELEGLKRSISHLEENDIGIKTLVTDRHVMVKKYMREQHPRTDHYFDVWHVAKGVTKKLEGCAKKKGGEVIRPWIKSASNHMYWTAMTSGDDCEMKRAKWNSLVNHVADKHEGHSDLFPRCQHGPNDRDWMEKGSRPHKMLAAVVQSPYLLKDIGKLSPVHQTYGLEVYHNVVNHFASKSNHYFYTAMLARLYLAALHYNENSNNAKALTKDGQQKWQISYPKAKKGSEVVVKPCRTPPTYGKCYF
ncbi:uncharacterized protein [Argopecten irradians]|uniref:uncharacterized protein n=1 Tax=Argopecten irradians TaxID=31199 RepID=UPI0037150899